VFRLLYWKLVHPYSSAASAGFASLNFGFWEIIESVSGSDCGEFAYSSAMMSDQERRSRYEPEGNYGSFWNIPAVSYDGSFGGHPQHQSHPHGYYGNGASLPASLPTSLPSLIPASLPAGGGPMSPPASRPQSASPDENSQPPVIYSGRSALAPYVVKPDPDRSSSFFHHSHKVLPSFNFIS